MQAPTGRNIDLALRSTPANGWSTFVAIWLVQVFSAIGSAMTHFALIVWITTELYPTSAQEGQLAWALVAFGTAPSIFALIASPMVGAVTDRYNRRKLLIASNIASGCVSVSIVALLAISRLGLPSLIVIAILNALFQMFISLSFETVYAMLVPYGRLTQANGMVTAISSVCWLVAPGIVTALMALPALTEQRSLPGLGRILGQPGSGAALVAGLDAATFFAASLALVFLRFPALIQSDLPARKSVESSVLADLKEGLLYLTQHPSFLWLLGSTAVFNLTSGAFVLLPMMVRSQLAPDWRASGHTVASALALLTTVGALGGSLGALLVSTWGGLKRRRIYGDIVPSLAVGLVLVLIGTSSRLYLSAALLFLVDFSLPILISHGQAIWQAQTPRAMQGRIFALRRLITQVSSPTSNFIVGWFVPWLGPGSIFMIVGGLVSAWYGAMLFNPRLTRIEDPAWIGTQSTRPSVNEAAR